MLMILLSILNVIRHLICGNSKNWLLNLNLIYETLWTGARSGLLKNSTFFNAGKTRLVLFDRSYNTGAIDVKIDGPVLEEKLSFKMLRLAFSSKLDWGSYITLLLKLPPRTLELWFVLWSFFLLRLLCISTNLPYDHASNTAAMSGLVLLVATWNCWISYKNG